MFKSTHLVILLCALAVLLDCEAQAPKPSTYRWTKFVQVEGQPEPVPAEWVSTPEGKFAHSIVVPNAMPKDSGYRAGMTSRQYFDHLCEEEAGEFIYGVVDNVEGFYFARPSKRPTDDDLSDRYKLEAPEIQRLFQLLRDTSTERAQLFINPPWNLYKFVEEPSPMPEEKLYIRSSEYRQQVSAMTNDRVEMLLSKYGVTWRGVKRPKDREFGIAGGEWIVFDIQSREPLALMRNYGLSPGARNTREHVWWLNASQCSTNKVSRSAADNAPQLYSFISKVLRPAGKQ